MNFKVQFRVVKSLRGPSVVDEGKLVFRIVTSFMFHEDSKTLTFPDGYVCVVDRLNVDGDWYCHELDDLIEEVTK